MSLWVDKHRPNLLSKLDYHLDQARRLKSLVHTGDFPHLLIYGPSGAGKKTRISCLLRELYGCGAERTRLEHQQFTTPSKKKLEITTLSSNYHIEVNPSEVGINDRVVIQELIKTVASTHQLDSAQQRDFKIVVLLETDKLTKDAQHALRRTMEKYMSSCRLILSANSTSKVIPAIRSRCLPVRVSAPTTEEIISVLKSVCKKECIDLPEALGQRIAEKSDRNLRRALLMLETCRVQQFPLRGDQHVELPDWQVFVRETASMILTEQSPKRLLDVRARLYELLTHCIAPDMIMKGIVEELLSSCDASLRIEVIQLSAVYEHRLQIGQKAIFHLEAFIAKFMSLYKKFIDESMMGDW